MKILYLTPLIPYPALQGNQMTGLNRIKELSKSHQVTLVAFYSEKNTINYSLEVLRPYCEKILPVYLPKRNSVFNILTRFLIDQRPLQELYYHSPALNRLLTNEFFQKFDVIHINTIRMEQYAKQFKNPILMDLHDSMTLNIKSRLVHEKGWRQMLYKLELLRISQYEQQILKKYQSVMVLAEQDREALESPKVKVIHLGVDTAVFYRTKPIADNKRVIFTGNMSYSPNVEAVCWFIDHCWKEIKKRVPDAKFYVVGVSPSSALNRFENDDSIIITGQVVSIADMLNESQVAVVPMQSGSGMQNKVLEAMACELPVVCSSVGIGNIKAEKDKEAFVEDTAKGFIEKCVFLLQNHDFCTQMGQDARHFIMNHNSIESHCRQLEDLYSDTINLYNVSLSQ